MSVSIEFLATTIALLFLVLEIRSLRQRASDLEHDVGQLIDENNYLTDHLNEQLAHAREHFTTIYTALGNPDQDSLD